jgi:hypothetical protein
VRTLAPPPHANLDTHAPAQVSTATQSKFIYSTKKLSPETCASYRLEPVGLETTSQKGTRFVYKVAKRSRDEDLSGGADGDGDEMDAQPPSKKSRGMQLDSNQENGGGNTQQAEVRWSRDTPLRAPCTLHASPLWRRPLMRLRARIPR